MRPKADLVLYVNGSDSNHRFERTESTALKLKLAEWASIAEIIGAVAVIVSLIYVGLQVNDNTAAVRSAAANDASVAMQVWYLEMGSNRDAGYVVQRNDKS